MASTQTIRTTRGRGRVYDSVLDTIGDTPCIRINNLGPSHARIYVKAEFFNPAASVKDRLAVNIIEEGERSGGQQVRRGDRHADRCGRQVVEVGVHARFVDAVRQSLRSAHRL